MTKIEFCASIIKHNGKDALMLKKILIDKKEIAPIVEDILDNGEHSFPGSVGFANKLNAVARLRRVNLL